MAWRRIGSLITNWTLVNKLQWNLNQNTKFFIQEPSKLALTKCFTWAQNIVFQHNINVCADAERTVCLPCVYFEFTLFSSTWWTQMFSNQHIAEHMLAPIYGKMHLKISSAKWRPFSPGLAVLRKTLSKFLPDIICTSFWDKKIKRKEEIVSHTPTPRLPWTEYTPDIQSIAYIYTHFILHVYGQFSSFSPHVQRSRYFFANTIKSRTV